MDRSNYISSLPFIIPLQSQSWPPIPAPLETATGGTSAGNNRTTGGNVKNINSTVKVLLLDTDKYNRSFYLSIELATTNTTTQSTTTLPVNNVAANDGECNNNDTIITTPPQLSYQTAFFVSSATGSSSNNTTEQHIRTHLQRDNNNNNNNKNESTNDVGMTKIQIAVEDRIVMNDVSVQQPRRYSGPGTNTTTGSRQAPSSSSSVSPAHRRYPQINPQQNIIPTPTTTSSYSILYMMVNDHVYAIDIRHLRHCEIIPEVYTDQGDGTNKTDMNNDYDDDDDDDAYLGRYSNSLRRQRPIIKPPSLVLRFNNNITFRIFSFRKLLSSTTTTSLSRSVHTSTTAGITDVSNYRSISDLKEEKETLQLLYDRINSIRVQQQQQQQQQSNGINTTMSLSLLLLRTLSPTRSSTTSGSSNSTATPLAGGQLDPNSTEVSLPPTLQRPAMIDNRTNTDNNDDGIDDDVTIPCLERIKRRKLCGNKLYDHLLDLKCFLNLPQSVVASNFRRSTSSPLDTVAVVAATTTTTTGTTLLNGLSNGDYSISPLLNAVAEVQKLAYVPSYDLDAALTHYDTLLQMNQNEMDTIFNDFYPSHHRKIIQVKREFGTGRSNDQQQQQQSVTNDPALSLSDDEIQVQFEQLIKKQKYLMTERYKLFCLPSR